MVRISRLLLLSVSFVLVFAAACTPAIASQNLVGTHWKLTTLNGQALVAGSQITLDFNQGNQIDGNSGCNSYGGEYVLNGSAMSFNKMLSTLMACADQSINDQEAAFNQAMSSVAAFEISNGQLNLKDAAGTIVLTFIKD